MNKTGTERFDLSTKELLKLFAPLSLSDMILVVAMPTIGAVMGRLPDVTVQMAGFGAAIGMSILLESPIIMMLHAATAAAGNPVAYRALGALMWLWNGSITLLYALVAFTPLYPLVAEVALGLPHDVAEAARSAFSIMLLWPAAIGVRRYMQGQLIYHRRSREIMFAGFVRLGTLVLVLITGALAGMPGAALAGLASVCSVITEATAVWLFTRRLRRSLAASAETVPAQAARDLGHGGVPERLGPLFWWYLPLAGTQVLVWLARPLITAGIARAGLAALSLAAWPVAWPVAWSMVNVLANGTRMVQQLTITMVRNRAGYLRLRNFALMVGGLFSAVLAVVAFTPLAGAFLTGPIGMPEDVAEVGRPVLIFAAALPLQVAVQNWMQGLLVQTNRTGWVNLGAFVGGVITIGGVFAGALIWKLPGAGLAAAASSAGLLVELACLWYFIGPVRRQYDLEAAVMAGAGSKGRRD